MAKTTCNLCGTSNVLMQGGYCINRTRCAKRTRTRWVAQNALLERSMLLLISTGDREAVEAIEKVMKRRYGTQR